MQAPGRIFRSGAAGLLRWSRAEIRIEPEAGRLVRGRKVLELSELRYFEVQRGFLTLGTDRTWWTIDLQAYRDESGPLLAGDALSPSAARLLDLLREALQGHRERVRLAERPPPEVRFDLRYRMRVDRTAIALTSLMVGIFLVDLYYVTGSWQISWGGTARFLGLLGLAVGGLALKRRVSRLRLDARGIEMQGALRKVLHPWNGIREVRRQEDQVELVGDGLRIPLPLGILSFGECPLILRRGRQFLSPPGRLLLEWLPRQAAEVMEPPLRIDDRERWQARRWLGAAVGLNALLFFAGAYGSDGGLGEWILERGARTEEWVREPWRLITALFLHGSLTHLFFNMLMLAVVGPWMALAYGWPRTWAHYLLGGALGNLIGELLRGASSPPAVGASTAILALLGALLGATYRRPERIPLGARARFRWAIPASILLTLGIGPAIPVLDNGGHLGGFLAGLALAWAIPPLGRRVLPVVPVPETSSEDDRPAVNAGR